MEEQLRNKIRELMDSNVSIVDTLDINDLHLIDDFLKDLIKTGRHIRIQKLNKNDDTLHIDAHCSVSIIKKSGW